VCLPKAHGLRSDIDHEAVLWRRIPDCDVIRARLRAHSRDNAAHHEGAGHALKDLDLDLVTGLKASVEAARHQLWLLGIPQKALHQHGCVTRAFKLAASSGSRRQARLHGSREGKQLRNCRHHHHVGSGDTANGVAPGSSCSEWLVGNGVAYARRLAAARARGSRPPGVAGGQAGSVDGAHCS